MKIRGESILNLILILCGLAIMIFALRMGFGIMKRPGSGLFPFFCGLIIFLANAILLGKKSQWSRSLFDRQERNKFIWMIVPFVVWILLMPIFGYILITFLSTLLLAKILRLEGWRKPLILSLGTTALSYLLFGYYLYLDLPRGMLNF
jgi:hypothetical protein